MIIDQNTYQKAFDAYLRKGIPIELSIKQNKSTGYYIWRTHGDNKVRSSHAAMMARFLPGTTRLLPVTLVKGLDAGAKLNHMFQP